MAEYDPKLEILNAAAMHIIDARKEAATMLRRAGVELPDTGGASQALARGSRHLASGAGATSTPAMVVNAGSASRITAEGISAPNRHSWSATIQRWSTSTVIAPSAVVDELQRYVEVGLLQHGDDGLKVVALLRGHADLVALNLSLDALGSLVADELGDFLGVLAADALLDRAAHLVGLAGRLRLTNVERLHGDVAADELFLEDVDGGLDALLGGGGDGDGLLALPRDGRIGAAEVEAGGQLLGGLVQRVVDLLTVNLADDVER
jgi:hypothetical protein